MSRKGKKVTTGVKLPKLKKVSRKMSAKKRNTNKHRV